MGVQRSDRSRPPGTVPVVIIGAGIGGLTLAAICRQVKLPCIVLERTEELTPLGAGISLAPNALRVLEQLGIYQHVRKHGQPLRKMLVHYDTERWREMDFTGLEDKFDYPVYSIERATLHGLLLDAAGGKEAVTWGSKVTDIIDDKAASHVVVRTADGRQFSCDIAVGADGIRSVTRRILARNSGLDSINSISFTGRVHMSGYTKPLQGLGREQEGVGNWLFYDDAILTTWPCKDNRQWYIGVKVWPPLSPMMVMLIYVYSVSTLGRKNLANQCG